jgi:hypothetical protein
VPAFPLSSLAVLPDDTVIAGYEDDSGRAHATYRPLGQSFTGDQVLTGPGVTAQSVEVATGAGGDAVVAYNSNGAGLSASFRRAGQTSFGPTATDLVFGSGGITYAFGLVGLGLDGEGNAVAATASQRCSGTTPPVTCDDQLLRLVAYDNAAPRLSDVSIPGAASTGSGVSFSANARDLASAASLSWTFGDGTGAAGNSVSHAYGAPGSYTVTVTATDQAGNSSAQSGTVVVTSPAASGGGGGGGGGVGATPNPPSDEPPQVAAAASGGFNAGARFTEIKTLVVKNIPAGATVYVKCAGGGCPFKGTKKTTFKKAAKSKNFASYFNVKNKKTKKTKVAKLKPKARVEIGVSAPGMLGKFTTYTIQSGKKKPKVTTGCLAVGSTKKTPCG